MNSKYDSSIINESRLTVARIFQQAQEQEGVGGHHSQYSKEQLIVGYYLPMSILAEKISVGSEAEYLFQEECYRYTKKDINYKEQTTQVVSVLREIIKKLEQESGCDYFSQIIKNLRNTIAALSQESKHQKLSILLIGDCLMTDIRCFLRGLTSASPVETNIYCNYFGASQNASLNADEIIEEINEKNIDIVGLSFLSYDGLPYYRAAKKSFARMQFRQGEIFIRGIVDSIKRTVHKIREKTDKTIVLHNCGGLPLSTRRERLKFVQPFSNRITKMLSSINEELSEIALQTPNCYLLDETAILERSGARYCNTILLDKQFGKQSLIGHRRYFGKEVAAEYLEFIEAYALLKSKKLLAIDFDNTLWRGVMADGDIEHFHDRQRLLLKLKDQGIVLAAVSKNSPENIKWNTMSLKEGDFVSMKINWDHKSKSILDIASELNLGVDSFVFVDDNPVERDLVSQAIPKVLSLDATQEKTWRHLSLMEYFPCTANTEAAKNRTEMYRSQARRNEALGGSNQVDHGKLMRSLGLKLTVAQAKSSDIERCHELAQRTNQFNTTTYRYALDELEKIIKSCNKSIYTGRMRDKFGDLDLVLMLVLSRESSITMIESFIMSCRAMGFGAEYLFLQSVLSVENIEGPVNAIYYKTEKNTPAINFLRQSGFISIDDVYWRIESRNLIKNIPDWFA